MKTTEKQRGKTPGGITGKGWQPGQSGNPKGRPRTAKFSEATTQIFAELEKKGKFKGLTKAQCLAEHCYERAVRGSTRHADLLISYNEGKPRQAYEVKLSITDELPALIEEGRKRAAARKKK